MNAGIIDDELEARRNLRQLLLEVAPDITVSFEAASVEEGVSLIRKWVPGIIFLDIQMQDGSGFDLMQRFPDPDFQVVFVTAYDQYAIKAFEYTAIDYLLKPIQTARFKKAIKKAQSVQKDTEYVHKLKLLLTSVDERKTETIVLQTQEGHHYVQVDNIVRLEADKNYTTFHCIGRKDVTVTETIKRYENVLTGHDFFRPHQSHIVNRKFVKSFMKDTGGYIEMSTGAKIPIARRKKESFFNWIRI